MIILFSFNDRFGVIMMNNSFLIFFFSVISVVCFSQEKVADWNLKLDKEDIKVFIRKSENSGGLNEFKATVNINANLHDLVHKVQDIDNYADWMFRMEESSFIEKQADGNLVGYFLLTAPWPAEKRDNFIILKTTFTKDKHKATIKVTCNPQYDLDKEGVVRMIETKGFWKFEQLVDNSVAITYSLLADPGGNLPAWVVNLFMIDGPYETLLNLKNIMEKSSK